MGDRTRSGGSASMTWAAAPVVCGDSGSSVTRTVAPVLLDPTSLSLQPAAVLDREFRLHRASHEAIRVPLPLRAYSPSAANSNPTLHKRPP